MTQNTRERGTTLVLGGTGKTGRRVAGRLTGLGLPVRVGSRSGEPPFDWQDEATWAPALEDVGAVYLAYAPDAGFPGASDTIGAFAARAAEAGVRRLVLLSGRGEEGARRSEQVVRDCGVEWTIVRAAFFSQNFSEDFLVEGVRGGVVAFPAGGVAEPFVDAEDIADVAVAALTGDGHAGELYEVTGPRLLTFAGAVAEIARAVGREVGYLPVSLEEFTAAMAGQGAPPEFTGPFSDLLADILDGRNASLCDGVRRALGREPRDFAEYARATAATGVWDA
ncbi:NAD(P)H-binding protein [Actinorugispora endophytica]|nr:NAD(P)H-binding protein [Actinorugispora endophytica]